MDLLSNEAKLIENGDFPAKAGTETLKVYAGALGESIDRLISIRSAVISELIERGALPSEVS